MTMHLYQPPSIVYVQAHKLKLYEIKMKNVAFNVD